MLPTNLQEGDQIPINVQQLAEGVQGNQNNEQNYFYKRSMHLLRVMKCIMITIITYRTIMSIVCFIPINFCWDECLDYSINIILAIWMILEILKVGEALNIYLIYRKYSQELVEKKQFAQVPFQINDLRTVPLFTQAINLKHSTQNKVRISLQMQIFYLMTRVSLIYYLFYTIFFYSYIEFNESLNKTIQNIFALFIWSFDTAFFVFPYVLSFLIACCIECSVFLRKYHSLNNRILRSLNVQEFIEGQQLTEENICIICWDNFKHKDQYVVLKCNRNHVFHHNCIDIWIKNNTTCPVCRQQLI